MIFILVNKNQLFVLLKQRNNSRSQKYFLISTLTRRFNFWNNQTNQQVQLEQVKLIVTELKKLFRYAAIVDNTTKYKMP